MQDGNLGFFSPLVKVKVEFHHGSWLATMACQLTITYCPSQPPLGQVLLIRREHIIQILSSVSVFLFVTTLIRIMIVGTVSCWPLPNHNQYEEK